MTLKTRYLAIAFVASAIFAAVIAETSKFATYRLWAQAAAPAYAIAAVVTLIACVARGIGRRRLTSAALLVAVIGGDVVPLAWAIRRGLAMPELHVIVDSGQRLLAHGTPFIGADQLASDGTLYSYDPYLPGMSLIGSLAHALHADLRILFLIMFVSCLFIATHAVTGNVKTSLTIGAVILACPFIAVPLVVGGDDLPVLGFTVVALAFCNSRSKRNEIVSGVALGFACGLKAIAFPAFPVLLAFVAYKHGRRSAIRFSAISAVTFAILVAPSLVISPSAFIENVVMFPLGMAAVATTASDPLIGHLIAIHIANGRLVATALLAVAAVAIGASLLVKPPTTMRSAANRLAWAMVIAFVLAPSVRWGYFTYPAILLLWSAALPSFESRARATKPITVTASGEAVPARVSAA